MIVLTCYISEVFKNFNFDICLYSTVVIQRYTCSYFFCSKQRCIICIF